MAAVGHVVTSASHDLALAWHPVLSSSFPLLSSFLSLDVLHTHPIQLILLPEHQPRVVIGQVFASLLVTGLQTLEAFSKCCRVWYVFLFQSLRLLYQENTSIYSARLILALIRKHSGMEDRESIFYRLLSAK
jgi:hypothetical protein